MDTQVKAVLDLSTSALVERLRAAELTTSVLTDEGWEELRKSGLTALNLVLAVAPKASAIKPQTWRQLCQALWSSSRGWLAVSNSKVFLKWIKQVGQSDTCQDMLFEYPRPHWDAEDVIFWFHDILPLRLSTQECTKLRKEKIQGADIIQGTVMGILTISTWEDMMEFVRPSKARLAQVLVHLPQHRKKCLDLLGFKAEVKWPKDLETETRRSRLEYLLPSLEKVAAFRVSDHLVARVSEEQQKIDLTAMSHEFVQVPETVCAIFRVIHQMYKSQPADKYAPYTALLQSTCFGKTKTMLNLDKGQDEAVEALSMELGGKWTPEDDFRILGVYINCTVSSMSQSAVKPTELDDTLLRKFRGVGRFLECMTLIGSIIRNVRDHVCDKKGRLRLVAPGCYPVDRITGPGAQFSAAGDVEFLESLDTLSAYYCAAPGCQCGEGGSEDKCRDPKRLAIILVFDEAQSLLEEDKMVTVEEVLQYDPSDPKRIITTPVAKGTSVMSTFRIIRRSLRMLHAIYDFISPSIFMSTNARAGNFLPTIRNDPSRRELFENDTTATGADLHEALLLHETFDLFANRTRDMFAMSAGEILEYVCGVGYIEDLARMGRPHWGAILNTVKKLRLIWSNATSKLIIRVSGKEALFEKPRSDDDYRARLGKMSSTVACLGFTAWIEPIVSATFAPALVQAGMGFLHTFSSESGFVRVGFPSEPVLAVVASNVLKKEAVRVVETFNYLSSIGDVDIGGRGELAARILCLLANYGAPAIDREYIQYDPGMVNIKPRRFEDFFSNLIGAGAMEEVRRGLEGKGRENFEQFLAEGHVAFCGFRRTYSKYSGFRQALVCGLKRSTALVTPEKHPGIDLLIPVMLKEELGVLAIDAKSVVEGSRRLWAEGIRKPFRRMPFYRGRKAVLLVLNVAARQGKACVDYGKTQYPVITVYGMGGLGESKERKDRNLVQSLGRMANMERHGPRASKKPSSYPVSGGDREVLKYGSKVVKDFESRKRGEDKDKIEMSKKGKVEMGKEREGKKARKH